MKYTVIWLKSAEQKLADLWTNAPDRNAVAAADVVDDLLQRDPHSLSESRSESVRLAFQPPLVVLFRVDEPNRKVYVMKVDRVRRP
jgi:hypothetical protein